MLGGASSSATRSESDKERTKMRERQRRAITTKIFHGLRKHGGYRLSPRSDINEVLRQLAKEAGWIIEPDGTTYRCKVVNRCPTCRAMPSRSTTATPTNSSTIIGGDGGSGGPGEGSTTTSPRGIDASLMMINSHNNNGFTVTTSSSTYLCGDGSGSCEVDAPLAFYTYSGLTGGLHCPSGTSATSVAAVAAGGGMEVAARNHPQQQGMHMQEARISNQNTPVGHPCRSLEM